MPETTTTHEALSEADRQLAHFEDVCLDEDGTIPPWVVAARQAVRAQLLEADDA